MRKKNSGTAQSLNGHIRRRSLQSALTLVAAVALLFVAAQTLSAQTPAITAATTVVDEKAIALRQQSFDLVWRTVKEKHFDPTLGGLDWDEVRRRYEPRVALGSEQEFYRLLQQMLGELRQSHFGIVPPAAVVTEEDGRASTGTIGIDLRLIDGQAVIVSVKPDSSAARAGLKPGYIIRQAGDKTVEQLAAAYAKGSESEAIKNLRLTRRILAAIDGTAGSDVQIDYLDERNRSQAISLRRERYSGEIAPRFGNMPPHLLEFETARYPDARGYIGYIRLNSFAIPVMSKVREAIREFGDAQGLIFDLRGNPGGVGGMAAGIAGNICEKPGSLGTMKLRSGAMHFAIFPQADPYTGPVAVLIDGLSASTSEVFASGLQELGRAVIIGERSVGAALPSVFHRLPTGALFQFAIADFKTPKGVLIEGRGVIPDTEMKWNRATLLAGRDAQLEAAIEHLRKARRKGHATKK